MTNTINKLPLMNTVMGFSYFPKFVCQTIKFSNKFNTKHLVKNTLDPLQGSTGTRALLLFARRKTSNIFIIKFGKFMSMAFMFTYYKKGDSLIFYKGNAHWNQDALNPLPNGGGVYSWFIVHIDILLNYCAYRLTI